MFEESGRQMRLRNDKYATSVRRTSGAAVRCRCQGSSGSQRQPPVAQPQRRPRAIYARREKRVVARPAPVLHLATPLGVLRRGSTLVLRGVGFQPSKATIRPASRPVLDGLVRARPISPRAVSQIEGHLGFFHGYARRLGRDRACAIARYLVQHGIARDRLRCIGFGETRPLVAPKTRAARLRNTRVEIRLL